MAPERPAAIPPREFEERRANAVETAAERGLDGLVVWSRGGASADCYGDVYYLANYHTPLPPVPNTRHWSGRGHTALVLAPGQEPTLLTDVHDDPEDRVRVQDVREAAHLPVALADLLREKGLDRGRLGFAGATSLLARDLAELESALGRPAPFQSADDLLESLRYVKSEAEIELLRHAGRVGCEWMNATMGAVAAGRTDADAVGAGLQVLAERGGQPYDVAIASGPDVEHFWGSLEVPHWNPWRKLRDGDLLHADLWGPVQGYLTDFVRSTVVGGEPTADQRRLLDGAIALVEHIIEGIEVGATFDSLWRRGATWLSDADGEFSESSPSVSFGHSMGIVVERPFVVEGELTELRPNVVVAIETCLRRPGVGAAGFERNVVVTERGVEILDATSPARWWSA